MKAGVVTATLAALVASTGVHASLHPSFPMQYCTKAGCTTKNTSIVMDGKEITLTDESQYPAHGIDIQGNVMKLTLKNGAGPRVYLAASDTKYEMIKLVGKELTYDVDTSQLDCTMNGALYFVQMPESGADKGSGYCDANGVGGTNCEEMDIWEANQYATAMTVHPTSHDSSGCGLNPYRRGHKDMYGPGANFSVDTSKPFSVVTQFLADTSGAVNEMRRMYLQNGNVIQGDTLKQDKCNVAGMAKVMQGGSVLAMSIWASSGMSWLDGGDAGPCPIGTTSKDAVVTFSNIRVGDIGTTAKGTDQTPPPPPSLPPAPLWGQCGGLEWEGTTECAEGTCIKMNDWTWKCQPGGNTPTTTKPTPTPSTTNPGPTPTSTTTKPTPTSSSPSGTVAQWGQCGGINYSGPTTCASGFKCVHLNDWYYQCQ